MDPRTSGPLRRNFSNGFSGKPIVGPQKLSSRVEDYTEIFGGVGSSSIPVLDLSADNDTSEAVNFRSSDLDYSNIFGGFRDEGIGVSYEELVCNAELRGERNLSGNIGTGSATGSPSKSSDHSLLSKENQVFSSEAPYLSFNDKKHFNMSYHKTSVGSKDESNEKIHVARFHPEPGFTFFVDDSTPQKSKADQPDSSITSDIRKLDFSDGLLESHHNKKAMPHPDTKKTNRRQVDPAAGFNQDGSYSNVKLLNAHVINLKPIPSNERLSPNGTAHKENSNGITKRSTASNSEAPKGIASEQATGDGSLPLFDQELDVNSAAAVSAAALKDAIQKAQKSIRMAKELMERKKAGLRNHPNQGIKPSSFPYLDKETLMKQVIVEKEEEDEKAHDMGFIKGKVHAVIKEMDKENVDKLVCNMHQHVEMETPPISQEDEDCEKTLVESQQNVEENMEFEYHELRCADYEEMMHKTQEPDQNKQHANSQQEHFEKRAENTKEEPEYTPRNICDVEVERFEDAIEGVENENQPRNRGSEGDGKEKKGIHMAEDVESDRGHMTIDEKRSTLHDGEESGENFRRFELKESKNYVRRYGDEKPENIEKESVEIRVLPQAHYRRSMSRESGPWSSDASENNADSQGTCRPDMINDNYSKTNQQVDDKSRSIDKATTDFYDFKVREAEEAKIACTEFSETASLVHGAAEGRNNMKTVFEVLPSENSIPKFGLTEMDLENTEAEKRERDFGPNINSDNGAQILVNRSLGKGYIFEENETYCDEEAEKNTHEIANGEGQHVVIMKNFGIYSGPSVSSKIEKVVEVDKEIRARHNTQINEENSCNTTAEEDKEMKKMNTENDIDGKEGHPKEIFAKKETETKEAESKGAVENEYLRKNYEENKRERQREKDRIAVERAIQEARDRAFAEARERAAMDRAAAEVRQRVMVETRGKLEKSTTTSKSSVDRASIEAKIRSERAAVERATAEARERALEKALSQNTASRAHADKSATGNVSDSFRDAATKISDGTTTESAQRSKARSERQERIMERAAKALAEKNMRDLLVQKEEAEKNRLAESLDTEIKRWSSGKEGNLRALLSTLHYILGPGSGWQPISLTDIITTNAVKKAYRKATLYVHPDKLQQRGASIREKYICEKVFDLLKVAWNRFNSEER